MLIYRLNQLSAYDNQDYISFYEAGNGLRGMVHVAYCAWMVENPEYHTFAISLVILETKPLMNHLWCTILVYLDLS